MDRLDSLFGAWETREIAQAMNSNESSVRRWRHGHRRPQPSRIQQLGETLARLRVRPAAPTVSDITQARQDVYEAVKADFPTKGTR